MRSSFIAMGVRAQSVLTHRYSLSSKRLPSRKPMLILDGYWSAATDSWVAGKATGRGKRCFDGV